MNGIFINYDPFAMESQILIVHNGNAIGDTYSQSEVNELTEKLFDIVTNSDKLGNDVKVYVRAPDFIYDELTNLVQAHKKNYSINKTITMEQIQ